MIVITVRRMDGFNSSVCAADEAAAGTHWASLIDKACRCAEERRLSVDLAMWEIDAANEAAAKAGIDADAGRKIKSVRIQPPKQLLHKVTENTPGAVTDAVLQKSQGLIDAKAQEYPALARLDLVTLQEIHDALAAPGLDDAGRAALMRRLYAAAYKMKGQGGTFGYPLITAVAHHLYVMSKAVKTSTERLCEAIQVHIDAMQMILNRRLSGSPEDGQRIVQGLNAVVVKIVGAHQD